MFEPIPDPLDYYAHAGPMTDPKEYASLFEGLPHSVEALCQLVQGLVVHIFWAERYGLALSEERKQEVQIRPVSRKIARVRELDDRPLFMARPLEKRLVGNCRDFSVILSAMLRYQGIPARARCGFGVYFLPDHYEDHWVAEYWKADEERWVMVDAQLDAFQRETLHVTFSPLDVPPDQFLTAGKAWQMCRAGKANPDHFGIFEWHGMGFIRGNVVRDFLSLHKIEILPWDHWGLLAKAYEEHSPEELDLFNCLADLTLKGNDAFPEVYTTYENEHRVHVPIDMLG